jgi:hypothetical protein
MIQKPHILKAVLASGLLAASAAPAAASAAPVDVKSLTVSPACVRPGADITANVTVQNTTVQPVTFYAQEWATEFGITVQRGSVLGPNTAPPLIPVSQGQTTNVPWWTPWGQYTVYFGDGPSSSDPTSWSQASTVLTVSPFC